MTSKERLAPMSMLPVVVVSTMISVEFGPEMSRTFKGCRKSRQSGAPCSKEDVAHVPVRLD